MALTVTNLVNALAVAAATPAIVSSGTVTALQAGSASLTLFGKIKSVGMQSSTKQIILWWAVVPYDSTDGIAPQVAKVAHQLPLKWSERPGQYNVSATVPIGASAGYLHTWLEIPSLPFSATVIVDLVESPLALVNNQNHEG